jgi:CPA1 family monovalent cation:H+ antiporter
MIIFELAIALLLFAALMSLWANRMGVPYPALLALGGAVLALIPGTPQLRLDPELALALFVAPVLLDAAYDASPRDMRYNLGPILNLAFFTVVLTTIAVAVVARLIVPDMPWAAAIALGAIVSPPDAAAATAVLRRLQPPHRLLVILEGESLFNDATALLIFRVAALAAVTGTFSAGTALVTLLLTGIGGVLAGVVLAQVVLWTLGRIEDIQISVLLQFLSTFAVWIIAARLGLSPIITMVTYAMYIARRVPSRTDGRHRIASYAVWEVAVFVLNALAFLLIGLQLRGILQRITPGELRSYLLFAVAICATVIVVRILWWMPYNALGRWQVRRGVPRSRHLTMLPTVGSGLVISWAGMRGIVTVAAALALPAAADGTPFPFRDLILLAAFGVVLGTLVVQGLTLGPLMRRVRLNPDTSVEREIGLARAETAKAALAALAGTPEREAAEVLRKEYQARLSLGQIEARESNAGGPESTLARLQRAAVAAQRTALDDLRRRELIGDDAFHAIEAEIDVLDLTADGRIRPDGSSGSPIN